MYSSMFLLVFFCLYQKWFTQLISFQDIKLLCFSKYFNKIILILDNSYRYQCSENYIWIMYVSIVPCLNSWGKSRSVLSISVVDLKKLLFFQTILLYMIYRLENQGRKKNLPRTFFFCVAISVGFFSNLFWRS